MNDDIVICSVDDDEIQLILRKDEGFYLIVQTDPDGSCVEHHLDSADIYQFESGLIIAADIQRGANP